MSKNSPLKARLPRGLADRSAADIRATERMLATIRQVYERYGFEPVETPLIEYTDALGKFLPDLDRPNEGVFSFQDDDEQWLSLRYDLTAPLARYVAENWERLPKPYRSYRAGWVFRNEKPGPGRFRQFMQFDADTVGAASPAADAEICMMAADTLEALGIPRGQYVIKVNSRKVLDGVLEAIRLGGDENAGRRLTVLRAIDKLDKLGPLGVRQLLSHGRLDESGDYTRGAELASSANNAVLSFATQLSPWVFQRDDRLKRAHIFFTRGYRKAFSVKRYRAHLEEILRIGSLPPTAEEGLRELETIRSIVRAAGYKKDRIRIDPSVVRGLEYYTGAVFEAELTFQVIDDKNRPIRFGSIGGGGRYDGLVGRFMNESVPATGFSMGVSRLQAALALLNKSVAEDSIGPVVVLVMDRDRIEDYQGFVQRIRDAKLRYPDGRPVGAEMYLGVSGMRAQMKYADRRKAPLVVIQGEDEKKRGKIQIKSMELGLQLSSLATTRAAWTKSRNLSQQECDEDKLVDAVKFMLQADSPDEQRSAE